MTRHERRKGACRIYYVLLTSKPGRLERGQNTHTPDKHLGPSLLGYLCHVKWRITKSFSLAGGVMENTAIHTSCHKYHRLFKRAVEKRTPTEKIAAVVLKYLFLRWNSPSGSFAGANSGVYEGDIVFRLGVSTVQLLHKKIRGIVVVKDKGSTEIRQKYLEDGYR